MADDAAGVLASAVLADDADTVRAVADAARARRGLHDGDADVLDELAELRPRPPGVDAVARDDDRTVDRPESGGDLPGAVGVGWRPVGRVAGGGLVRVDRGVDLGVEDVHREREVGRARAATRPVASIENRRGDPGQRARADRRRGRW